MRIRVYYDDTDAGGVVYYANYLKYFERARTELIEELGLSVLTYQERGIWFTVVRAEVTFLRPATYGDVLEIISRVEEVRRVRFIVSHEVRRAESDALLVAGSTTIACVNGSMKPLPLPPELSNKLKTRMSAQTSIESL